MPECATGRERAGKTLEGFDIVAAVPSAVVDDPADALASMRRDLLPYFGLPFYRAMIERSGFGDDIAAYDEAAARGDGEAMQARDLRALPARAVRDRLADDVRAGLDALPGRGRHLAVRRAVPRTDFEATLRAAAPG